MSRLKELALDTSVVSEVLGTTRGHSTPERAEEVGKLLQLEDDGWTFLLPSPVLAEVLAGLPIRDHHRVLDSLRQRYRILDVTVEVAALAGRIAAGRPRPTKATRQSFKMDTLIVATASYWKATGIATFEGEHGDIVKACSLDLKAGPPSIFTALQVPLVKPGLAEVLRRKKR